MATYLSTVNRDDSLRYLREWISHVEPGAPGDAPGFVDRTTVECYGCQSRTELMLIRGPYREIAVCRRCLSTDSPKE